jgi:hypothetical protein
MEKVYSTRQAAGILQIKPDLLQKGIWQGKVTPPAKGPSGNYLWTVRDIEAAAWVMKRYPQFKRWQEGGAA